jgi:hypothetical protein
MKFEEALNLIELPKWVEDENGEMWTDILNWHGPCHLKRLRY